MNMKILDREREQEDAFVKLCGGKEFFPFRRGFLRKLVGGSGDCLSAAGCFVNGGRIKDDEYYVEDGGLSQQKASGLGS